MENGAKPSQGISPKRAAKSQRTAADFLVKKEQKLLKLLPQSKHQKLKSVPKLGFFVTGKPKFILSGFEMNRRKH